MAGSRDRRTAREAAHGRGPVRGIERSILGTNWPVDRLFSSYPDVLDAYATIISGSSRAEQEALVFANAERIFRI
jgi:predicted TIM-barrel fold metal-dependent hydrolase